MKQLLFTALSFIACNSFAQVSEISELNSIITIGTADEAPSHNNAMISEQKALWNIQYSSDVTTAANGSNGQAAVAYFNNEFWTSIWSNDTIIRYTNTGTLISKFTIPGISGVRSITTDGTNLYMANNTSTIYFVNPITQAVTSTIIATVNGSGVRFLTYDATLDGGAGGFWVGNFSTDIIAISMAGAYLITIPAAAHTLTGMYGAAIDNFNAGGPYLWVFDQAGANNTQITVLNISTGTPTVFTHDVMPDIAATYSLSTGLAGGAFFTTDYSPGQPSIMGLVQGTPVNAIVVYDALLTLNSEDIAVNSMRSTQGYTKIPSAQIFGETFEGSYQNLGTSTVDTIYGNFDFYYNANWISTQSFQVANVASGATGTFTSAAFPMANGVGSYDVKFSVNPDLSVTDINPANDEITYTFEVTDSIFARDDGVSTGTGYTVSVTDSAYAASLFTVNASDMVTGIWVRLESPTDGDSTFALIYNYNGSTVTNEVVRGTLSIISAGQYIYYLTIPNGIVLSPGTYAFGLYEGVGVGIGLAQSNSVYTANVNYFMTSGAWTASGVQTARFIRPIFGNAPILSIDENVLNDARVYPVPARDEVTLEFVKELSEAGVVSVVDLNGRAIVTKNFGEGTSSLSVPLKGVQAGTYLLNVASGATHMVRTIVVQ